MVVTGASLSILTLRYKETIKQLSEEIKALDKSMQVIELHGVVRVANTIINPVIPYSKIFSQKKEMTRQAPAS